MSLLIKHIDLVETVGSGDSLKIGRFTKKLVIAIVDCNSIYWSNQNGSIVSYGDILSEIKQSFRNKKVYLLAILPRSYVLALQHSNDNYLHFYKTNSNYCHYHLGKEQGGSLANKLIPALSGKIILSENNTYQREKLIPAIITTLIPYKKLLAFCYLYFTHLIFASFFLMLGIFIHYTNLSQPVAAPQKNKMINEVEIFSLIAESLPAYHTYNLQSIKIDSVKNSLEIKIKFGFEEDRKKYIERLLLLCGCRLIDDRDDVMLYNIQANQEKIYLPKPPIYQVNKSLHITGTGTDIEKAHNQNLIQGCQPITTLITMNSAPDWQEASIDYYCQ